MAESGARNAPPSEKESGVTFNTPITNACSAARRRTGAFPEGTPNGSIWEVLTLSLIFRPNELRWAQDFCAHASSVKRHGARRGGAIARENPAAQYVIISGSFLAYSIQRLIMGSVGSMRTSLRSALASAIFLARLAGLR